MPGWIIQGVRGEGKSLCAVGKIREYLEQGRPVATNLDLYLDKLLPSDNSTPCYRLPDHPRLQDFELLPPAYDPKYKGEDKNGLLVLDELGTWLNTREWSDKTRLGIAKWLFLSRKNHWDLILLAQDVEMIDNQIRTTLCDYLVQASRTDRAKIPYLGSFLQWFGFSGYAAKRHVYFVFYGLNTQNPPVDVWKFKGHDLYEGYDTNQLFRDGKEVVGSNLVDMRATYTYVPPNILTRHKFIAELEQKIQKLKEIKPLTELEKLENKVATMAVKKTGDASMMKAYLLIAAAVLFLGYRFLVSPPKVPTQTAQTAQQPQPQPTPQPVAQPAPVPVKAPETSQPQPVQAPPDPNKAIETANFIDTMLANYKPRLSSHAYSEEQGFFGFLEWYNGKDLVEKISIADLHSFGVAVLKRSYGVELIVKDRHYAVTSWPKLQQQAESTPIQLSKNP